MKQTYHIEHLLKQLSLTQKLAMLSGEDFWRLKDVPGTDIKGILLCDGPHGLRKQVGDVDHVGLSQSLPATCYPTASALACSWDRALVYKLGEYLARECQSEGVSVLLGPGANIKRNPLCGRNFEYFSEDPLLSGQLAAAWINGLQSKGIGASLKHFVANNQEYKRMVSNVIVDQRSLREIYLKSFEIAIKNSHPWTVMTAYNMVNGTYMSEHSELVGDILYGEWQYQGLCVSDWAAINDRVAAVKVAVQLEMPGNKNLHTPCLRQAVKRGDLSMAQIDRCVKDIVALNHRGQDVLQRPAKPYDYAAHHQFAREIAAQCIVLLKNDRELLPLNNSQSVALIGAFAKEPRYQGTGSSMVVPSKIGTAYQALQQRLQLDVRYAKGYHLENEQVDKALIHEAMVTARQVDVVIVMVGLTDLFESEGFDRDHLHIPENQNELIRAMTTVNQNVVVCLSNGAPVTMPWIDSVDSVVEQYLTGQASGEALIDVLYGEVNPSAKLAESFPLDLLDLPSSEDFLNHATNTVYSDGLLVGYRALDTLDKPVLFPFGYGLSYTSFEYRELKLNQQTLCRGQTLQIHFTLSNSGQRDGKEIVQLYIEKSQSAVYRPLRELKDYKKVYLASGQSSELTLKLSWQDLAIYQASDFVVEAGQYTVYVAASSRDLRLQASFEVQSDDVIVADKIALSNFATAAARQSTEHLAALFEQPLPIVAQRQDYHFNSPLQDLEETVVGKLFISQVKRQLIGASKSEFDPAKMKMLNQIIRQMPFRAFVMFSDGQLTLERAQGLLDMMNRDYFTGIRRLFWG